MFDLSFAELAVIGVVAFVVVGPEELPTVLRSVRKGITYVKGLAGELTAAIDDAVKESDIDLKSEAKRINDEVRHIVDMDGKLQRTYDIEDFLMEDEKRKGKGKDEE
jgi:sec-independent protein translocase protein TatB